MGLIRGFLARITSDLFEDLSALSLTSPAARPAIRSALASIIACLVAFVLELDAPWWAALTGFVVVRGEATATFRRCLERICGSVTGAVLGFFLSALAAFHLAFALASMIVTTVTIYAQARTRFPHAVLFGGATVMLVMFGTLNDPDSALQLAFNRAVETSVGVIVAALVDYALAEKPNGAVVDAQPAPRIFARPIDANQLGYALIGGLAVASIPTIWQGLELPGFSQTPFTTFIILGAMGKAPWWKAANRFTGGLLGGAYGIVAMHVAGDNFLLWIGLLFLGLFCAGHVEHRAGDAWYAGMQAGITIVMAMIQGPGPGTDLTPGLDRIAGILGGVVLIGVFQFVFDPFRIWLAGGRSHTLAPP